MNSPDAAPPSTPRLGTVLVVDDEEGVRELARRILEPAGYAVLEAADGQLALDIVSSGAVVDFLMVDLDMPVMRGDELAVKLQEQHSELRILFVTAHSDLLFDDRPEQLPEGSAFLEKPFSVAGLLEAVSLLKTGSTLTPPEEAKPAPSMWRKR